MELTKAAWVASLPQIIVRTFSDLLFAEMTSGYNDLKMQGGSNGKSSDVLMQGSSPQLPFE